MIYILTALFQEAKPYIEIYRLKRTAALGGVQLFEGEDCRLTVCGIGPVKAAAAAAHTMTRYAPRRGDLFVNIGAAGSLVFNIGEIVLCHKIVNTFTGGEFYPAMLYEHPFREGILGSSGSPVRESRYELTDMEGAFAYEAALTFLPAARIQCVKVISDRLNPESVSAKALEKLMSVTAGRISEWLDGLAELDKPKDILTEDEGRLMEIVSKNMRLTFAMNQKLRQVCVQAKIRGVNAFAALMDASEIAAVSKTDSKEAFVGLISRLSEGE
ncbi:MAG: hypothetical protein LBS84_03835 [Clostridiales bacterium]|jgi:hypothetical protein|nr:hypothetical protein [Clostridiales bacterium]